MDGKSWWIGMRRQRKKYQVIPILPVFTVEYEQFGCRFDSLPVIPYAFFIWRLCRPSTRLWDGRLNNIIFSSRWGLTILVGTCVQPICYLNFRPYMVLRHLCTPRTGRWIPRAHYVKLQCLLYRLLGNILYFRLFRMMIFRLSMLSRVARLTTNHRLSPYSSILFLCFFRAHRGWCWTVGFPSIESSSERRWIHSCNQMDSGWNMICL